MLQLTKITQNLHPPLGRLLIAGSILLFGDHALVWRLPSFLCGFGVLAMTFLLASKLFRSHHIGLLAAGILSVETLSFTQSRIAMFNAVFVFLSLLSAYVFLKHVLWGEWPRKASFLISGIFFGLAMGTKWMAFGIFLALLPIWFVYSQNIPEKKILIKDTLFCFLLPAVLTYFCTFIIILFIRGYEPLAILKFQLHMLVGHWITTVAEHPDPSEWWTWPLTLHPVLYFFSEKAYVSIRAHHKIQSIYAVGNLPFFWGAVVFIYFMVRRYIRERRAAFLFVLAGYFGFWLQWAFLHRVKFLHYYYPALPFLAMAAAYFIHASWQQHKSFRIPVVLYVLSIVAFFIYWYPLLNGTEVSGAYFKQHLWLPLWK
ncbi:MAG TPA: glycosyltransferase family 39 protein [Candidatus Omnitrophota bacterium]|nr:glycosyltransferase family 39 protein [Candidatus Omnitrophota bacterium]